MKTNNNVYFLVILLTLVAPLLVFAQQDPLAVEDVNALRLRAETDAKRDASQDITGFRPFFTGIGAGFAGGMCAIMTGCTVANAYSNVSESVWIGSVIVSSTTFVAPLIWYYNNPPYPPVERLIGEHPEYIEAYVNAYGRKSRFRQRIAAYTGAAVGCGIIAGWVYMPVNYSSFWW